MSRVIKFRALTKNNNVMCFGDLITCPNGEHRVLWFELKGELPIDVDYDSFNEVVSSDSIGQFVGLTDKNGVEIYEGDIVEFVGSYVSPNDPNKDKPSQRKAVEYDTNTGCYNFFFTKMQTIEVVGNIHQNPELLKC